MTKLKFMPGDVVITTKGVLFHDWEQPKVITKGTIGWVLWKGVCSGYYCVSFDDFGGTEVSEKDFGLVLNPELVLK